MSSTCGNKTLIAATLAVAYAGVPVQAAAAGPQVGPLLNLATYSFLDTQHPPAVARSSNGNFVVSWQPHIASNGDYGAAQVQSFAADGSPLSPLLSIGKDVRGNASVAIDASGDFVVAWTDGQIFGDLYAQRYSAVGKTEGAKKWIGSVYNAITYIFPCGGFICAGGKDSTPLQVAMDDDGDFVVGWTSESYHTAVNFDPVNDVRPLYGSYSSSACKTYAVAYRSNGTLLKARTQVDKSSSTLGQANKLVGIAMNGQGSLAMVYNGALVSSANVPMARFYSLDLKPATYLVNLSAVGVQGLAPGMFGLDANGRLAVAWLDANGSGTDVLRYNPDGSQYGSVIGPIGSGDRYASRTVSVAGNGDFTVTWNVPKQVDLFGTGSPLASEEKDGQLFNFDGSAKGAAFVIDSGLGQLNGGSTAISNDDSGNIVTVWPATMPDYSLAIVARTVSPP